MKKLLPQGIGDSLRQLEKQIPLFSSILISQISENTHHSVDQEDNHNEYEKLISFFNNSVKKKDHENPCALSAHTSNKGQYNITMVMEVENLSCVCPV